MHRWPYLTNLYFPVDFWWKIVYSGLMFSENLEFVGGVLTHRKWNFAYLFIIRVGVFLKIVVFFYTQRFFDGVFLHTDPAHYFRNSSFQHNFSTVFRFFVLNRHFSEFLWPKSAFLRPISTGNLSHSLFEVETKSFFLHRS